MMTAVFVGNEVTAHAYGYTGGGDLKADMLIGTDTTHEGVYKASVGDGLDITGQLDISDIKTEIKKYSYRLTAWLVYKGAVNGTDLTKVYLYDGNIDSNPEGKPGVRCTFVATFELPEGLNVSSDCDADLEENDLFEKRAVSYDADQRQITVTMSVKNTYDTFQKLKDDLYTIKDGQKLTVRLKGVSVANDAVMGRQYTVKGSFTGSFWTNMRVELKDRTSYTWPQFNWTGVQTPEGADVVDSDGIKLTYEVVEKQ